MQTVSPENTKLGWIGTGRIGLAMCGHLLKQGYPISLFNRTKQKALELIDRGAAWADSPRQVAEESDVVFTIVGNPTDVREVVLGQDGVLAGAGKNNTIVDMTTSQPSLALEIASAAAKKGVATIDAPVSGGDVGARNATLSIMVGGAKEAVDRVMPLFEAMGKTIVHQGGPGAGQHAKAVNQILITGTMTALCEGLVYANKAGLDATTLLHSVSSGAAGSWSLSNLAPRILEGNFDPGFSIEHFIKDMQIALAEAERLNLAMPGVTLAHQLYSAAEANELGGLGTHALYLELARMSGVDEQA
ncbi:MAG: NAD(P)-dependent oxidoreductase [Planctomycetales bacterium]